MSFISKIKLSISIISVCTLIVSSCISSSMKLNTSHGRLTFLNVEGNLKKHFEGLSDSLFKSKTKIEYWEYKHKRLLKSTKGKNNIKFLFQNYALLEDSLKANGIYYFTFKHSNRKSKKIRGKGFTEKREIYLVLNNKFIYLPTTRNYFELRQELLAFFKEEELKKWNSELKSGFYYYSI